MNSRVSRLPFLNFWLLDPAKEYPGRIKMPLSRSWYVWRYLQGDRQKAEMAGYSKIRARILRLAKHSADGLAREQRGVFTGRSGT
jgi:hypothetical protein